MLSERRETASEVLRALLDKCAQFRFGAPCCCPRCPRVATGRACHGANWGIARRVRDLAIRPEQQVIVSETRALFPRDKSDFHHHEGS